MQQATEKTFLVVGASGATGRLLVGQLLDRGARVKALVRSPVKLPETLRDHPRLLLVHANLLELGAEDLDVLTRDCDAIASCLGHNLDWKGIWGPPYRLVTEATRRLCNSMNAQHREAPGRFVLMNSAGNSNCDLDEPLSLGHRLLIGLIRVAVPPHRDNELAADWLRTRFGDGSEQMQWCVVRPDTLIDENELSDYRLYPSPTRDALFDPGRTSRLNVARFMADLMTEPDTWTRWQGRMPVVYNQAVVA